MANWKDIAVDNFNAAELLVDGKRYRSATSRFYYAVFSALTYELVQRGAATDFVSGRSTPSHAQMSDLIDRYFNHFTPTRRMNLIRNVAQLYRDRLAADYSSQRVDRDAGREASRLASSVFQYLGVTP